MRIRGNCGLFVIILWDRLEFIVRFDYSLLFFTKEE